MNRGLRIILQGAYPKCIPILHSRGLRSGYTEDAGRPGDIRDREAANEHTDMPLKDDDEGIIRQDAENPRDQEEKLKEEASKKIEGGKHAFEKKKEWQRKGPLEI
ncbi:hypothetical protein GCK32_001410 [Trichostrongylus colubriformis]|uniref:Uncharacterized protein n=1 Tax=Trichostrongylus colubriformis TaxID=6319 RepID=A0AAN8EW85_TRICO